MHNPGTHPHIFNMGKWQVHEWVEASSTNDLARHLAPWSIARCELQHSGRGRFNRPWIGAKGGLWCSFTVPLVTVGETSVNSPASANAATPVNWGHLPLVAGLACLDMLEALGIANGRLRWPNDLMIGMSKLGGILVERPSADMAIIGIGINIANDTDSLIGKVAYPVASISRLLSPSPSLIEALDCLSQKIADRFTAFSQGGLAAIFQNLNQAWKEQKNVQILTDGHTYEGTFIGIDHAGNPLIRQENGTDLTVESHLINRLIEI